MTRYALDVARSRFGFSARAMPPWTRAIGVFAAAEGELEVTPDERGHATGSIATDSVDTGIARRDAHLRSADFLDADAHPRMTFTAAGIPLDGEDAEVAAQLTIKGITRPVHLRGAVTSDGRELRLRLAGTLRRTDFGVRWKPPMDPLLVGRSVDLDLDLVAVRHD